MNDIGVHAAFSDVHLLLNDENVIAEIQLNQAFSCSKQCIVLLPDNPLIISYICRCKTEWTSLPLSSANDVHAQGLLSLYPVGAACAQ